LQKTEGYANSLEWTEARSSIGSVGYVRLEKAN
jgi:hypothetical protein